MKQDKRGVAASPSKVRGGAEFQPQSIIKHGQKHVFLPRFKVAKEGEHDGLQKIVNLRDGELAGQQGHIAGLILQQKEEAPTIPRPSRLINPARIPLVSLKPVSHP